MLLRDLFMRWCKVEALKVQALSLVNLDKKKMELFTRLADEITEIGVTQYQIMED